MPYPLNGGLQVGPQMRKSEEAVRFYAHFGLTLTEEQKELPDHLTTERNSSTSSRSGNTSSQTRGPPTAYLLARRDFIARHRNAGFPS
ncbi:MAG: hypothetical protein IPL00_19260 [Gammaproteobacteria bacterium]|nr:hypothetical protein [Gammaproteobacteria bacterium]